MSDLEKITDAIKETLEDKLAEFRSEIRESQEKAAATAIRKAKEPMTFRKKAHQEQHKFNERMDETMEQVQVELEAIPSSSTSQALTRAREELQKGRKLIAERQKLIRIADRADLGWAVVEEYTADELADDSGKVEKPDATGNEFERELGNERKLKCLVTQYAHLSGRGSYNHCTAS